MADIQLGPDIEDAIPLVDTDAVAAAAVAAGETVTKVDLFGISDERDVAPVEPPPQDVERAAVYHAQRIEPSYSEFVPELIDQYGREYSVARAGSFLARQDGLHNASFMTPPLEGVRVFGRLLLFLRMPISQRWSVDLPAPTGETLELYVISNQVQCTARTESVFVAPRARTGYLIVSDFESHGQVLGR